MLPHQFLSFEGHLEPLESPEVGTSLVEWSNKSVTASQISIGFGQAARAVREVISKMQLVEPDSPPEHCSQDSHVDSDDSGLIKKGYIFKKCPRPPSKNSVNNEVTSWNNKAQERLRKITNEYNKNLTKTSMSFSAPLGVEMNRKLENEVLDYESTVSSGPARRGNKNEDEFDMRRNDAFMREVRRVLYSKKNVETLKTRSLEDEYRRQISKKMNFVHDWVQKKILTADGEEAEVTHDTGIETSNAETGGGDMGGPMQSISNQLSKMVLKNKIAKNSKAAQSRKEIFRRAEEKRDHVVGDGFCNDKTSDGVEDEESGKFNRKKVRFEVPDEAESSKKDEIVPFNPNCETVEGNPSASNEFLESDLRFLKVVKTHNERMTKVESYLSGSVKPESVSGMSDDDELPSGDEQLVFDNLAGEFLKAMVTRGRSYAKITKNDSKLLSILVKRYITRGQLSAIDELMNSNLDDKNLKVPPYDKVADREEFFLKTLIRRYIRRGMRNQLEDKIAWVYYKLEAVDENDHVQQGLTAKVESNENEIKAMVNAFKSSGKNPSMNRIVMELIRDYRRQNPNLSLQDIGTARENIRDLVIGRFARMYLKEAETGSEREVVNEGKKPGSFRGVEHFDANGCGFDIKWKSTGVVGKSNQHYIEEIEDGYFSKKENPIDVNTERLSTSDSGEAHFPGLEDKFWGKHHRHTKPLSGKPTRTCTVIRNRPILSASGSKDFKQQNIRRNRSRDNFLEDRKQQAREENRKWLLRQRQLLWEAKKMEARKIDKFTHSLPKRLEKLIKERDRLVRDLDGSDSNTDRVKRKSRVKTNKKI